MAFKSGMKPEIIKLIEENPDLPVIPIVDGEVVGDYDQQGRYIYDLTDDEWDELYNNIPRAECIAVYITT